MVRSECLGKLGTGRCSTLMPIFLSPGLGAARKLNEMRFLFPSSECSTSGWRGWMLGCCCCCCTGVCTGSVPCCTHVSAQPKKKNVMCTAARLDGSFPPRLEVPNDNTTTHCSRLAAGGFFCALLSTDSGGFRNATIGVKFPMISSVGWARCRCFFFGCKPVRRNELDKPVPSLDGE